MGEDFKVDPSSVIDRLDRDLRKGRIVMLVVSGFLGLVVVMGFWLGLSMLKFQNLPSSFRAVPYIMMGAPIIMMLLILCGFFGNRRKYWKLRSVLSTASSADFRRICPWCSGTAFEETPCCRRFTRSWEPGDLNRAWQDYVVSGMTAFVIIKRGSEDSTADTSMFDWILNSWLGANTWQRRITQKFGTAALVMIAVALVLIPGVGGVLRNLGFGMLWGLCIGWGFSALLLGNQKGSRQLQCVNCDYVLEHSDTLSNCPECGSEVTSRSVHYGAASTAKSKLKDVVLIGGGGVLIFLLMINIQTITSGVSGVLPTSILTRMASNDFQGKPIWSELVSRPMSVEESDALLDVLVESCSADSLTMRSHPGLVAIETGTWPVPLDQDQIDRVHGMSWQPEIRLPDRIRAGEPFELVFTGESRPEILPAGRYMRLAYAGVSIDGVDSGGQSAKAWTLVELNSRYRSPEDLVVHDSTHTIDTPGPHRLRVTYWLYEVGIGQYPGVTWGSDGELDPPAGSTWRKRFDIELEIDVME